MNKLFDILEDGKVVRQIEADYFVTLQSTIIFHSQEYMHAILRAPNVEVREAA